MEESGGGNQQYAIEPVVEAVGNNVESRQQGGGEVDFDGDPSDEPVLGSGLMVASIDPGGKSPPE